MHYLDIISINCEFSKYWKIGVFKIDPIFLWIENVHLRQEWSRLVWTKWLKLGVLTYHVRFDAAESCHCGRWLQFHNTWSYISTLLRPWPLQPRRRKSKSTIAVQLPCCCRIAMYGGVSIKCPSKHWSTFSTELHISKQFSINFASETRRSLI